MRERFVDLCAKYLTIPIQYVYVENIIICLKALLLSTKKRPNP